jgi:hypothetical protein
MDGPAVYCFGARKIFADFRLDKRLTKVFDRLAKHPEGTLAALSRAV